MGAIEKGDRVGKWMDRDDREAKNKQQQQTKNRDIQCKKIHFRSNDNDEGGIADSV